MNFANFLKSPECEFIMNENRISIHIESGDIFFDNEIALESIYLFMYAQQNYEKKLLKFKLWYGGDFDSYLSTYLAVIKSGNDNKYDILTHTFCFTHSMLT